MKNKPNYAKRMARKGRERDPIGNDNDESKENDQNIARDLLQQPSQEQQHQLPLQEQQPAHDSPPYTLLINPNRSSNSPPVTPSTTYMNVTQRKKPSPLSLPSGMDSGDYFPRRRTVVAPPPGMEVVEDEMSLHALFGTGPMEDDEELAETTRRKGPMRSPLLYLDDNEHRYVGLRNQAMTCYLNSLVQTLYMTPEFRNAVYRWQFPGKQEDEINSIPCQLQKLFVLLQTSEKDALETKDLTSSFGWSSREAYEQHDVQELCRLMFDALERKWRNTVNSTLIHDLYRGTVVDFVRCLSCKKENTRADAFLDLPLAINNGGTDDPYKSVEDAIHAFVKPEILEGVNQYCCENCGPNQNALKGLRFIHLPYVLTILLKRFKFDRNTFHRIKLNDKMTFPLVLNLNEFVHGDGNKQPKNTEPVDRKVIAPPPPRKLSYVERAERQALRINREKVEAAIKRDGPYLYELFSVMVHQGCAAGGHYFAYIKNMDQDSWFCFNDSSVTPATRDDIHRTFGGLGGGWSSSNTNAYMLMYRRIDRQKNAHFVKTVNLPQHLRTLLKRWEVEEEEKLKIKRVEETFVNVELFFNGVMPIGSAKAVRVLKIPHSTVLCDLLIQGVLYFNDLEEAKSTGNIRLLKCASFKFAILGSFTEEEMEMMTIADVFPNCVNEMGHPSTVHFMLDCKPSTMPSFYRVTDIGGLTLSVVPVDVQSLTLLHSRLVQFFESETVAMMKMKLALLYSEAYEEAHMVRLVVDKGPAAAATMLLLDNSDLRASFIFAGSTMTSVTLYVDAGTPGPIRDEDRLVDFASSRMFKVLDRKRHSMNLRIRLPTDADYKHMGITVFDPTVDNELPAPSQKTDASRDVADSMQGVQEAQSPQVPTLMEERRSPTSPSTSDDEKYMMECDGSSVLSDISLPPHSPSLSEVEDISDMEQADPYERSVRFERTFDAVLKTVGVKSPAKSGKVSPVEQVEEHTLTSHSSTGTIKSGTCISSAVLNDIVVMDKVVGQHQNEVVINADGRMLVTGLKNCLSDTIGLPASQFTILKHYKEDDEGYESNITKENETIYDAYSSVCYLSMKLRAPLKENERIIPIVRFDLNSDEHEKWPLLFEVVGTVDMSVRALLQKCHQMLEQVYAVHCEFSCLRLRDMITGGGVPMLNLADHLGGRGKEWHKTIYLQIITEEDAEACKRAGLAAYPVMIRRWKPSALEVTSVSELSLSPIHKDQIAALKRQISAHYHVPFEEIELTEGFPTTPWSKWPYTKERIQLIENVQFTSAGKLPPNGTFNGKLVYFRAKSEKMKRLTENEKRAIRIADSTVKPSENTASRKPERQLRIQLSTSLSDDSPSNP
uniref:Ubiquitin carboxyl-terminal hydrolase 47 n=1 Tax=Ascaris suum TaxID=6253 RepID=F1KQL2_ASCSU